MAQLTAAALETALNGSDTNRRFFQVTKSRALTATTDMFYVLALTYDSSRSTVRPGTSRWCTVTNTQTTNQQRDAVYTAMAN